jgi:hypothetical protein
MTAPAPRAPLSSAPQSWRDRPRSARPTRAATAALAIAVAQLPPAHRHRYALEFLAELHDVGRPHQLRHALGLVVHAWGLRLALPDIPVTEEGPAMSKSLRCRLRLHHDVKRYNGEAQPPTQYIQCTRCGRVRDTNRRPPGVVM